jgi:polar amino acid transport system substrate-binding protein
METLRVGAAFPDPPFNGMPGDAGLDIDLMEAIAGKLGATIEFIAYDGADFNGIFDGLGTAYDCVVAGTTVTPEREKKARFVPPYLISGQSLAVDTTRLPDVRSVDDLEGLTIGVQRGNTSQPIADRLVADGRARAVRVYDYGTIRTAMSGLTTGECDAFMKLAPVLTELAKPVPGVHVVQRGISVSRRPNWRTTAHCSGSAENGWVIRTPTRLSPCTDQPERGLCHSTRLAFEYRGFEYRG